MCALVSLEIKIRNIEGLIIGRKLVRKNVFVVASTEDPVYGGKTVISTGICEESRTVNPTWNEKLTMTMPIGTKYILFDVCHEKGSRKKSVAIARVPTSDFIGGSTPRNYDHFLSYRLRDSRCEPNGIINFCVNVKGDKMGDCRRERNYKGNIIHGNGNYERSYVPKPNNGGAYVNGTREFDEVVVGFPVGWLNT